jgi:hypothetical protein
MALTTFRSDYRLWALIAGCMFVALGFVDPVAGATWKGDNSLWSYIGILLRGEYICSTGEMLAPIVSRALFHAVPAALIAWVAQALFVVVWASIRSRASASGCVSSGRADAS